LGSKQFEELQIMKFAWRPIITDLAAWNTDKIEEVNLNEFEDLLIADIEDAGFEEVADEMVVYYS
jgi:hypothetical protein